MYSFGKPDLIIIEINKMITCISKYFMLILFAVHKQQRPHGHLTHLCSFLILQLTIKMKYQYKILRQLYFQNFSINLLIKLNIKLLLLFQQIARLEKILFLIHFNVKIQSFPLPPYSTHDYDLFPLGIMPKVVKLMGQ